MGFFTAGVRRTFSLRISSVAALLILSTPSFATPPAFTGAPIRANPDGAFFFVNLRTQGVVTGAGPLRVAPATVFINGQANDNVAVRPVPRSGSTVCVEIEDEGFNPATDRTVEVQLTLSNPNLGGPITRRVAFDFATGPTVPQGDPSCLDPNTRPVANAGADRTIADTNGQPGELVTLDGSASSDSPYNTLSYVWVNATTGQQFSGVRPQVNVPDGVTTFRMTVTDDSGDQQTNFASDSVTITVTPPAPNQPPQANAGPDRTVTDTDGQPGEIVRLDGSGSTDPDGKVVNYEWFIPSPTPARGPILIGTGPIIQAPLPNGLTVVTLRVTDDDEATATGIVQITVSAPNLLPTANAGPDQTLSDTNGLPGEAVTLDGRASTDSDGQIASYQWFLNQTLLGTGATLQRNLPDGQNTVTLIVTDDDGATATDTVVVSIAPPANRPPTANAGPDQTLSDTDAQAGESVTLDGRASSDSDGQIASYQWFLNQTLLGTGATLQRNLPDGANTVTLVVTDDDGASATDTVAITIAPPNQPPAANAGPDQTLSDTDAQPGENVTLDGRLSTDSDGRIVSYQWFLNQTLLGTGATLQRNLPDGQNTVTLVVTDDDGATASDTVAITIAVSNRPPTANAGPDQTLSDTNGQPGENVTLDGRQSTDPDGTIVSYQWFRGSTLLGSGAVLQTNLLDGDNIVTLVVTDDDQATASDTVQVTIAGPTPNRPPTANAGPDRTLSDTNAQPGEPVTLDGTGSSDSDGRIVSYQWFLGQTSLGEGATLQTNLPDGTNTVTLVVTDDDEATANDTVVITVGPVPNRAPTANAGPDQTLSDTNAQPGEPVTLDGTGSSDSDGRIVNYQWFLGQTALGEGATLQTNLPDGTNTVTLVVTDDDEATANDTVVITVGPVPNRAPTANAGPDQTLSDTNAQPGEPVTLNGTQSSDTDGRITRYEWFLGQTSLGTGATLQTTLQDGPNTVTLVVTDDDEATASDTVLITIAAPVVNRAPAANAGPDQTLSDSDAQPGEIVTLDGRQSADSDGTIVSYQWFANQTSLGTGATLQTRLDDGVSVVTLVVTDNQQATASDTVQITIAPPVANRPPVANAGPDQILSDTDTQPGEPVTLSGLQSSDPDGTIASYAWFVGGTALGNGATLQTRLPDGISVVTLVVTDDDQATASDTVQVNVAAAPRIQRLSEIPELTRQQLAIARGVDGTCGRLLDASRTETSLTAEQQDLQQRCRGLLIGNTRDQQVAALDALTPADFSLVRTQTLLFANTQYVRVMDRLMALRGGARGLSLANLDISIDGSSIPLAQLKEFADQVFGGGASADEPGGLLNEKLGVWARGNVSFGDADDTPGRPSFDVDQWAVIGGIDYRWSPKAVVGAALTLGDSTIDFTGREGGLDTQSWALSLYGSLYAAKNFYFDAIVNAANSSFDAQRNITYVDGVGLVSADAKGDTKGLTLSAGMSGGYDFLVGGFTLSPNVGVFYINADIDGFTENGAGGLNLIYDDQKFTSLTANVGLRATYAWNLPWGVVLPHIRVDYVREFQDDVEVFGVRFASDLDAQAPPILVETDSPDSSYMRLAAGMSAQLPYGLSGYVEYQRLQGFEAIEFADLSFGLRFQKGF